MRKGRWAELPTVLRVAVGGTGALLALALVLVIVSPIWAALNRSDDGLAPHHSPPVGVQIVPSASETSSRLGAEPATTLAAVPAGEADRAQIARSVVLVWSADCNAGGSGSIVLDGRHVLTNSHVIRRPNGQLCGSISVGFIDDFDSPPSTDDFFPSVLLMDDPRLDLAVLQLHGDPPSRDALPVVARSLELGDEIVALGFPGVGGASVTLTWGRFAGSIGEGSGSSFYKTDAMLNPGISGGAAFDAAGQFVGVPTAGVGDLGGALGLVRPAETVLGFLHQAGGEARGRT